MPGRRSAVTWLGTVEYGEGLRVQEEARERAIQTGEGAVFGLEHRPVITLGRRGGTVDLDRAAEHGFAVWRARRGGLATCHEPGQLVGYLILDAREIGVRQLVERVEGVIIGFLAGEGVRAARRPGFPGVWVDQDGIARKIAAIGLQIRAGWSMHGFALNLRNDLTGFTCITPCGIPDAEVTSLGEIRPAARVPSPEEAWLSLGPVLTAAGLFAKPRNAPGT